MIRLMATREAQTMSWFRVDDDFAFHVKTMSAGNPAIGMWVRAGAWSSHQLTDGEVPLQVARQIGPAAQAKKLVDCGLWVPTEGGYRFNQWEDRNPTRDQVKQRRSEGAERLRRWRERNQKP